jgi:hypothetical protein
MVRIATLVLASRSSATSLAGVSFFPCRRSPGVIGIAGGARETVKPAAVPVEEGSSLVAAEVASPSISHPRSRS